MLREILTISGRPGLYKLTARGTNCLIVETLDQTKKRLPVQSTDKVVSLGDISIYTDDGELRLQEVFRKIEEKFGKNVLDIDPKKAANSELNSFMAEIVPEYDRDRVYPSHVRKIVGWYNILVSCGENVFVEESEDTESEGERQPE